MAVIKATNSKTGGNLNKLVNYVIKEEKTEQKFIRGQNCNPQTVFEEMKITKKIFEKEKGREYKHFVQSFKPGEITAEKAHQIALEWSQKQFKGYEVLIATHEDKKHIHTHFVVNSVSFEDGSKYRQSKQSLSEMKLSSDRICEREGLSVIEEKSNEITSFNQNKYKALTRAFEGEYKSYVVDTAMAVDKSMGDSKNKGEFIKGMKDRGYEVKWSDTNKNVTFKDKEGHKVRLSNLEKTFKDTKFSKEGLENEFSRFKRKEIGEPSRGTIISEGNKPGNKPRVAKQPTNQAAGTEHEGENGVRKHTSKRELGDIETTIRGIEQGVKENLKRETSGNNAKLRSNETTSSRVENKQPNGEREHRPTIESIKSEVHSRGDEFER